MNVGAVVLHYRFWPEVLATLEALRFQSRPPDAVVIVDNQSDDGSAAQLREGFPAFEIIEAVENRGYAAGMNLGIKEHMARGMDAILLLTHECRLAPDALSILVARLGEAPEVGAVGPLLAYLSKPETVFSAGGDFDPRTWETSHRSTPALLEDWAGEPPRRTQWLDGAALLLRSTALRAAGPLNEDYFMYFEETEYLLGLQKLGWSVECVPAAVAWQESGGKPTYLWSRNRLLFLARSAPKRVLIRELVHSVGSLLRSALLPSGTVRVDRHDRTKALLHFLTRHWGPPDTVDVRRNSEGTCQSL